MTSRVTGFINCNGFGNVGEDHFFEAFLVAHGKIISFGSSKDIAEKAKSLGGEVVDFNGKCVLPGFVDSHLHIDELGMYLNSLDLRGTRSESELQEKLQNFASKVTTSWILGHGWDQELFIEKRWPTKDDLDAIEDKRPVMISRVCLHAGVLNSKALEISGISSPSGIVVEGDFQRARDVFKQSLSLEDLKKMIKDALRHASNLGLTCLGFVSCDERALSALMSLWRDGEIATKIRVYLEPGRRCQTGERMYEDNEILQALVNLGIKRGFGDEMLKVQGIKILADGSLGARTAWLTAPYSDKPDQQGFPNIGKSELATLIAQADGAGLQLAIHGIGDATIDMILDAFNDSKVYNRGHRIEHLSVLRPDQIKRLKELGLYASVQPHFVISDRWAIERLGPERTSFIHPFKSILESGIPMAFGTDAPVEDVNPWQTVYAAVTRGKFEDIPLAQATPTEALSIKEAIYCYTKAAGTVMQDPYIGVLKEGGFADFIIVGEDPFKADPARLKDIKVLKTYVNGMPV